MGGVKFEQHLGRIEHKNVSVKPDNDRHEAAELLRRILAAVERGEIDAASPAARRLLRRLEGALAAWESESETSRATARGQHE